MENVRIQDDLYTFVNQKTLDELVIPDDKPTAGGFAKLAEGVEKIMMGELETMAESKSYPNDYLKRACELYAKAMDTESKAKDGIAPALQNLSILDGINDLDSSCGISLISCVLSALDLLLKRTDDSEICIHRNEF